MTERVTLEEKMRRQVEYRSRLVTIKAKIEPKEYNSIMQQPLNTSMENDSE